MGELNLSIPADEIFVTDEEGNLVPLRDLSFDEITQLAVAFLDVLLYKQRQEKMH